MSRTVDIIRGAFARTSLYLSEARENGLFVRHDKMGGPGIVLSMISIVLWACASTCAAAWLFGAAAFRPFTEDAMSWVLWEGWPLLSILFAVSAALFAFLPFTAKFKNAKRDNKTGKRTRKSQKSSSHSTLDELAVQGKYWQMRHAVDGMLALPKEPDIAFASESGLESQAQAIITTLSFSRIAEKQPWEESVAVIGDLAKIWKSQIGTVSLTLGHEGNKWAWDIGRALGIDTMVDAYVSGVPVDDILA